MKRRQFRKRMTDREIRRDMTRLELRQASEVRDEVRSLGQTADEVAERLSIPKTLIKQLETDDDGRLLDFEDAPQAERMQ